MKNATSAACVSRRRTFAYVPRAWAALHTSHSFKRALAVSLCAVLISCVHSQTALAGETVKTNEADTQIPVYEPGKKMPKGIAEAAVTVTIASEPAAVWNALVNFGKYPEIFKRIKTSEVTRRDGDYVFIETYLKPQMFVKNQIQHTVCNVGASPNKLNWKQLDGNFKHVDGSWDLAAATGGKTNLTYTLHVDAGPIVPPSMVSFLMKFVVKEVIGQFKQYVEKEQKASKKAAEKSNKASRTSNPSAVAK